MAVPSQFSLFDCGQDVSGCLRGVQWLAEFCSDLFFGDVVSVGDAEEFSEASHLHGLNPVIPNGLEFGECCCGLGDPGENVRFRSFICNDCSQIFESVDAI